MSRGRPRRRPVRRQAPRRKAAPKRRRVRRNPPGCSCYDRCCGARGSRCTCGRCRVQRRSEHGKWALWANPPAKRVKRRKVRRRSRGRQIKVGVIGRCTAIEYIRGGKRWRHVVEGRSRLLAPKDGSSYIVADGIRVSRFLEG